MENKLEESFCYFTYKLKRGALEMKSHETKKKYSLDSKNIRY